jgi:hypothetical protein
MAAKDAAQFLTALFPAKADRTADNALTNMIRENPVAERVAIA